MPDNTLLDELRALLGEKGLLTDPADCTPYQTGARYDAGRAAFVARPATTQQVSQVVALCMRKGVGLVPQSGNTGLVAGSTPDDSGTQGVLSLDRLTGVFELDRVNRTVKAGAGLRLSDVNGRLEEAGLLFPIDLGSDPRLGGMVATNTGGSRFLRYGDVRRNTLGLTVVLADEAGTVLELTAPLRKNNTGPDWKQLFIGTSGAFGVVTECVLNLEPLPRQTATALIVPSALEKVPDLLLALEAELGTYLSAFEWMSGNSMAAAFGHVPSLRNPFPGGAVPDLAVLVEVSRTWAPREGEQPLDAVLEGVLAMLWERGDELMADALVGPPHETWALRHALSEGVQKSGKLIAFDLAFRRGDVTGFIARMNGALPERFPGVTPCDFGHVGDGGVHYNLVVPKDDPRLADPDFETTLREWVFTVAVEEFDGSFSAEHAIGRRNQRFYDRYTPERLKEMAEALKAATSPGPIGTVTF